MTSEDAKEEMDLPYGNPSLLAGAPRPDLPPTKCLPEVTPVVPAAAVGGLDPSINTVTAAPAPLTTAITRTAPAPGVASTAPATAVVTDAPAPATVTTTPAPSTVTTPPTPVVCASSDVINLSGPIMSQLLEGIFSHERKRELQGKLTRNINKGKALKQRLEKVKDITSGRLVQSGTFRLSHDVCQHQIEREKLRADAEKEAVTTRHTKKKLRKAKADKIREKTTNEADSKELHFMVRYFSDRIDKKLPDLKKATLRLRYAQTRHRRSPDITPYNSEEEDESREEEGVYLENSNAEHGSTAADATNIAKVEIVQALLAPTAPPHPLDIAAPAGVHLASSNGELGSTAAENTDATADAADAAATKNVQALRAPPANVPTSGIAALVGAAAALQVSGLVSL